MSRNFSPRSAPLWLVADPAWERPPILAGLSAHFDVRAFPSIDAIDPHDESKPFAIILTGDHLHTATAIRRRDDALAHVPLLGLSEFAPPAEAAAIDAWLPPNLDENAVRLLVSAWLPPATIASDRLAATFGTEAVAGLRSRLRDLLVTAMALIGSPTVGVTAHRVAGMAGILGYAELGTLWSAEPPADDVILRRETRKIIYALSLLR